MPLKLEGGPDLLVHYINNLIPHPLVLTGECAYRRAINERQLRAVRKDQFTDAHHVP